MSKSIKEQFCKNANKNVPIMTYTDLNNQTVCKCLLENQCKKDNQPCEKLIISYSTRHMCRFNITVILWANSVCPH